VRERKGETTMVVLLILAYLVYAFLAAWWPFPA
jgi:hypothetical protein